MLDQALDAAEALGEREKLAALEEAARGGQAALQHGGHHPAVAPAHLARRAQVLRMAGEAGIDDALDPRVLLQKLGDAHGVAAVALHAHSERLDASQRK